MEILNKKKAQDCVLFIVLEGPRKTYYTNENRQQTYAGNQRRNRLCHPCVVENFLGSQEQE